MAEVDPPGKAPLRAGDRDPAWCDGVALWLVDLADWPAEPAQACLSMQERERAGRFRFEADRRRHVAAHVALRDRLARHLGCSPADLRFEAGPFGKPFLAGLSSAWHFNLSHSADLALVALCEGLEVGVDLEVLRAVDDAPALASTVFGPGEQQALQQVAGPARDRAFLQGWTRKEACLKALGTGFSLSPQIFEAGLGDGPAEVRIETRRRVEKLCVRSLAGAGARGTQTPWVGAVARRLGPA
jgi:4'-phosphopantetheinyl transferase